MMQEYIFFLLASLADQHKAYRHYVYLIWEFIAAAELQRIRCGAGVF